MKVIIDNKRYNVKYKGGAVLQSWAGLTLKKAKEVKNLAKQIGDANDIVIVPVEN